MSAPPTQTNHGWFKATRSEEGIELIRANPNALVLAYVIAARARWREGFSRHGLDQGEAMLGDYQSYGMTRQQYRTAKQQLAEWQFATFRTTNAGTIAKLIDTRLFSTSPDDEQPAIQPTPNQRATSEQPLTKKERRKEGIRKDISGEPGLCEEIYQTYPLKVGKPAALRAIAKALTKRSADELLAVTRAYADARGTDLSYVPHPATWFNHERFNDDPATWTRQAAPVVAKRNQGTSNERTDHSAYDRTNTLTPPAAAVEAPEASEGFMEFLTAPAPQPAPPVVAVIEAHEVPTSAAAIEFAATMSKRPDVAQVVEEWLGEFTADPKANWRLSITRRLLRKSR